MTKESTTPYNVQCVLHKEIENYCDETMKREKTIFEIRKCTLKPFLIKDKINIPAIFSSSAAFSSSCAIFLENVVAKFVRAIVHPTLCHP